MVNAFGILGAIALFGAIVALLDWLARRKDRRSKHHPAAQPFMLVVAPVPAHGSTGFPVNPLAMF